MTQLTFWDEPINEQAAVWLAFNQLKMKQNNLRKGIFQRFDDLLEEISYLRAEIERLKAKNNGYK